MRNYIASVLEKDKHTMVFCLVCFPRLQIYMDYGFLELESVFVYPFWIFLQ